MHIRELEKQKTKLKRLDIRIYKGLEGRGLRISLFMPLRLIHYLECKNLKRSKQNGCLFNDWNS